jgi:hypothetical protein
MRHDTLADARVAALVDFVRNTYAGDPATAEKRRKVLAAFDTGGKP